MRNLKELNVTESIRRKKLIFTEDFCDHFDKIIVYLFFGWGLLLPFLIFLNPHESSEKNNFGYYLIFFLSFFCGYTIYRKATEKKLTEIESKFDLKKNKELINEYCKKMMFESYRNSYNIIIYNSTSSFEFNPNYKTSRIFLFDDKKIYFTMIKENRRLNIPVLFSQIILKYNIKKIVNS